MLRSTARQEKTKLDRLGGTPGMSLDKVSSLHLESAIYEHKVCYFNNVRGPFRSYQSRFVSFTFCSITIWKGF